MCSDKKLPRNMSSDEFAEELLNIFEDKLAQLPPEEQDARIEKFSQKAAKLYRAAGTTAPRHGRTPGSPLAARSRG